MWNKYQSTEEELKLSSYPQEVQDEFWTSITSIPFIQNLISENRPLCKDLPRDENGRAIIDLANPPIIEDADYFRQTALHFKEYGKITNLKPNANPNSEYCKFIKQEVYRSWYGMQRDSDGAWITGDMYFYLNYTPIIQSVIRKGTKVADRVVDFPEFWEGVCWRSYYIDMSRNNAHHSAEIAKRGAAHPYDEYVYTPDGLKRWGDVNIGDHLFDENGEITEVIDIPFDDECDIYELTLRDGRKVKASKDHLWLIDLHGRKNSKLMTTGELFNSYKKSRKSSERNPNGVEYICSIPSNKGVEFNHKDTKVDPYTFGLLLGDGCFRHTSCYYTCCDEDFDVIKDIIPYEYTKWNGKYAYRLHIDNWHSILSEYGLDNLKSEDKFIPDEYKYNSRDVRLNLLKGLIDSDGFVAKHNIYNITISSKRLADDILFICRSIGYNASYTKQKSGYKVNGEYKRCKDVYNISIHTLDILSNLPRKQKTITIHNGYSTNKIERTRIIDIKYIGKQKAKCVTVDNPTGLYLVNDFVLTHNSKSYFVSSILAKIFTIGENESTQQSVRGLVMAYQKEYLTKDGTLNKFSDMRDFLAKNTPFPYKTLTRSLDKMQWRMGYVDLETGAEMGTKNEILGISSKDDPDKARGKRSSRLIVEEFGNFPKISDTYRVVLPNVQEGDIVFGQMILIGTGGSEGSDFSGALEMLYNPLGFNIQPVENVYDKSSQGKSQCIFFFPAYINRKGCYNKDGISDVTKALLELCNNRYIIKYNTTDPMALTRTKAENPITLQDAIMRRDGSMFPVASLMERVDEIKSNPRFFDDIYVGRLALDAGGKVKFNPTTDDQPIRFFPHKDNNLIGAVEIFKMPEKDESGEVFSNRYIAGCDPYDDDSSETMSLGSVFIMDLFTDTIVAEYTGRPKFANDFYEIVRLLCMFYNAKLNYENNKKGLFGYFQQMNCLYLLTDTLEYLKDKDNIKGTLIGNKAKGTNATLPVNNHARGLIRDWLLKPVTTIKSIDGNETEVQLPNLMFINNLALLLELAQWNSDGNFDRVSALGMLMLLRSERLIMYGGDVKTNVEHEDTSYLGNDSFFSNNYKNKSS